MYELYFLPCFHLVCLHTVSYNTFKSSLPLVGIIPTKTVCSCRITSWSLSGPLSESQNLLSREVEEFIQSLCNLVLSFYKPSKSWLWELMSFRKISSPIAQRNRDLGLKLCRIRSQIKWDNLLNFPLYICIKEIIFLISLHSQLNLRRNERK